MLQYARCWVMCRSYKAVRPTPSRICRMRWNHARECLSTASTSTTAAALSSTSTNRAADEAFSARQHYWLLPALAAGTAVALGGGAALACASGPAPAAPPAEAPRSAASADLAEAGDNATLVAAAHELRRSLSPPHQSLFRVVCILVYEDFSGKLHRITGTNAEASTIGGSICAERAAMCKLREASDCKRVTKVVVVTDNPRPLAPGVLCREFLSAHLSPSTPVVMSGSSGCDGGGDASSAVVLGGLMYEEELDAQSTSLTPNDIAVEPPQSERGEGVQTDSSSSALALAGTTDDPAVVPAAGEPATSTCDCRATAAATVAGEVGGASETWPRSRDGTGTGKGEKEPGREGDVDPGAGAVVDVCTVGDLYPWRNTYGVTGRGELLRLGFLRQQVAEELSKPGLAETLGLDRGVLEAYDAAWRATAEDKRDGVHPIRYAAVALFPDGEAEIAHQLKALEYGATLDPVTLLAPVMMRRAKDGMRPSWIIVCDQFGLMHAPFAQARTFLSEHGFGETKVILHAEDGAVVVVKAKDLVPSVTRAR